MLGDAGRRGVAAGDVEVSWADPAGQRCSAGLGSLAVRRPELGPYRRKPSPVAAMRGRCEVHYDPYDLSRIWVRDQAGGWITVPWTQLPTVAAPFADFTWRYARQVLAGRGGDDTDQAAVARVLADLLHRAKHGPADRVIARTSAAAASSQLPDLPGTGASDPPDPAAGQDGSGDSDVEPFGVFDPLAQERGPW